MRSAPLALPRQRRAARKRTDDSRIFAPVAGDTDIDARRKRLRFRCWRRGSREADLLLGRFADSHLDRLGAAQLARLERLLECDDPDIWDWAVRGAPPPPAHDTDILAMLRRPPERNRNA